MFPRRKTITNHVSILSIALGCSIAHGSDLKVEMHPLFNAISYPRGTQPIAVEIENDGRDAVGMLHISGGASSTGYPVELPAGAKKRLTVYPEGLLWGNVNATLTTNQGNETTYFNFAQSISDNLTEVLLISDRPNSLAFIRNYVPEAKGTGVNTIRAFPAGAPGAADRPNNQTFDANVSPEDAPDRRIGYASCSLVVLGSGSERLSNGAVDALKLYALQGGTLVFVGGASSPVLADPRWQSLLPSKSFETRNVPYSATLTNLGGEPVPGQFTIYEPKGVNTARTTGDGDTILTAESNYGLGRTLYLAFNPFEAPFNRWDGRTAAIRSILRPSINIAQADGILATYQNGLTVMTQGPIGLAGPNNDVRAGNPTDPFNSSADPFSTKLPPASQVFGVLATYLIAVVPLNFLLLKKMKRAELAWFTAPVISLGFASALFSTAHGLYAQKMSTATQGVILMQTGSPSSVFVGSSQMFIPRAGHYDLGLKNVDSIGVTNMDPFTQGGSTQDAEAVDVGEIKVPDLYATNLAFRQIQYRQEVGFGNQYSLTARRDGTDEVCEVKNNGAYALTDSVVRFGRHTQEIGNLAPGQARTVRIDLTKEVPPQFGATSLPSLALGTGGAALEADVAGFRPGPQIGDLISERSRVHLVLFSNTTPGGSR